MATYSMLHWIDRIIISVLHGLEYRIIDSAMRTRQHDHDLSMQCLTRS